MMWVKFADDKEIAYLRKLLWPDETMIKLLGHSEQRYRGTLYQLLNMVVVA